MHTTLSVARTMDTNKHFSIIIMSGDKISCTAVHDVQESRVKILLDLGYFYQNC